MTANECFALTLIFLFLSLSLPLSLKNNKNIKLKERITHILSQQKNHVQGES